MTPQDCTNLLLALVSRDRAGGIAARVADYRRSLCPHASFALDESYSDNDGKVHLRKNRPAFFDFIEDTMALGTLLDQLIERASDGRMLEYVKPLALAHFGFKGEWTDENMYAMIGLTSTGLLKITFTPAAYFAGVKFGGPQFAKVGEMTFRIADDLMETAAQEWGDMTVRIEVSLRTIMSLGRLIAASPAE
jgi:hypothetical protein